MNGEPFTARGTGEPPTTSAQILTVTSQGVWVDGERADASAAVTFFFKPTEAEPSGEHATEGEVQASWCNVASGLTPCDHTLPDQLPAGAVPQLRMGELFGPRHPMANG